MHERYQLAQQQEKIIEREELEWHIKEEQRLREKMIKFYDTTWQNKYPGYSKWYNHVLKTKTHEHDLLELWSYDHDYYQQTDMGISGIHKAFEKQSDL
jgi:hypothetical protein